MFTGCKTKKSVRKVEQEGNRFTIGPGRKTPKAGGSRGTARKQFYLKFQTQ
jgi:hypothetical protein